MGNECTSKPLSSHQEWPLALERMSHYLQALKLPVSQQSQLLTAVEEKFHNAIISDSLTSQALGFLREAIAEDESCFCEYIVANHFGFADQRDLSKRSWSMPTMRRSAMVPKTRETQQPSFAKGKPDIRTS